MSFNESLADRVRELISEHTKKIEEKKMFEGLCFMVNDKMCVGVESNRLMVHLDPEYDEALTQDGAPEIQLLVADTKHNKYLKFEH